VLPSTMLIIKEERLVVYIHPPPPRQGYKQAPAACLPREVPAETLEYSVCIVEIEPAYPVGPFRMSSVLCASGLLAILFSAYAKSTRRCSWKPAAVPQVPDGTGQRLNSLARKWTGA
jgi:hypothetical protein